MIQQSNVPLTAACNRYDRGNGATVLNAYHLAARHKTAADSRGETLVPAAGLAAGTRQRCLKQLVEKKPYSLQNTHVPSSSEVLGSKSSCRFYDSSRYRTLQYLMTSGTDKLFTHH